MSEYKYTVSEQDYERLVSGLHNKFARSIESEAASAFRAAGTHEAAHDAVFNMLIEDARWTNVAAADISDVAYEAATLAEQASYLLHP